MSEQDVMTIKGGYDAFNAGNPEGVLAILADDVEWTEPGGGGSPSGTFNGPQSVGGDVFAKIGEQFEEFVCTPENYDDRGDTIVVTGRFSGKTKTGADVDVPFEMTWEMADGKVSRFEHRPDADAWAAAWS